MSLTPEEWRELDKGLRAHPTSIDNAALGYVLRDGERSFLLALHEHARSLIAASRPKCERCTGQTDWRSFAARWSAGDLTVDDVICPDCNGTGWAQ